MLRAGLAPGADVYYDLCNRSILVSAEAQPPDFMNEGSTGVIIRRGLCRRDTAT